MQLQRFDVKVQERIRIVAEINFRAQSQISNFSFPLKFKVVQLQRLMLKSKAH